MDVVVDSDWLIRQMEPCPGADGDGGGGGGDARAPPGRALDLFLRRAAESGRKVYIAPWVAGTVEESIGDPETAVYWHRTLNEARQQGVVVSSRHKYDLRSEYKALYHLLLRPDIGLSTSQARLVALAFQHRAEVLSLDERVKRAVRMVGRAPKLQWYADRSPMTGAGGRSG